MRRDDALYRKCPRLYDWMSQRDPENIGLNGSDLTALLGFAMTLEAELKQRTTVPEALRSMHEQPMLDLLKEFGWSEASSRPPCCFLQDVIDRMKRAESACLDTARNCAPSPLARSQEKT